MEKLIDALTTDAQRDIDHWARALWQGESPDTRGFQDRLAAALLLATMGGAAAGDSPVLGRYTLGVMSQRYAAAADDSPVFKTVFHELLDGLISKNPILGVLSPRGLDEQTRQIAFFVSGVTSSNVVEQIKDELLDVRAKGLGEQEFIQRVARISDRTGPELDNVFRTNVASAAGAGRWAQLNDPDVSDLYVAYRYVSRRKPTTRPLHAAMHDFIAVKEDPIWPVIWVPNGYRCMCSCRGVRRREGIERGLIDEEGHVLKERIFTDGFQEELVEASLAGLSVVVDGKEMDFPDEGFRGNALAGLSG